jgi:hypothetical protein
MADFARKDLPRLGDGRAWPPPSAMCPAPPAHRRDRRAVLKAVHVATIEPAKPSQRLWISFDKGSGCTRWAHTRLMAKHKLFCGVADFLNRNVFDIVYVNYPASFGPINV